MNYKNVFHLAFVLFVLFIFTACEGEIIEDEETKNYSEQYPDVSEIIDNVYAAHGVAGLDSTNVKFKFRQHSYSFKRESGEIERRRFTVDSIGREIEDIWWRKRLARTIDSQPVELDSMKEAAFRNSINSVFYFAFLPKGLKDRAVNPTLIGTVEIKGENYYKIKINFDEEGGGEDHQDIFIYWIHQENFTMDYMAYEYFTEGGGIRFREAINPRKIKGIRFQDYNNFAPKNPDTKLIDMDKAFTDGDVKLVSVIKLDDIELEKPVTILPFPSVN